MKSLLCAFTEAWQRVRIRKSIDDSLYFDERRWPRVADEQRDRVVVFRALVHEMYAQGVCCRVVGH